MIEKSEAARRQLECAIRLLAAHEDELAVHTLTMAAFGILNDLTAARTVDYDVRFKPFFTSIGWSHLTNTANFLKHANRDPDASLASLNAQENDWRIGLCVLLYRSVKGTLTPTMAAFHCWMVIRQPDEFNIAEDADKDFEAAYRDSIRLLKDQRRDGETFLLNALIETYKKGVISPDTGFLRRSPH
jgi:hypothetical protein